MFCRSRFRLKRLQEKVALNLIVSGANLESVFRFTSEHLYPIWNNNFSRVAESRLDLSTQYGELSIIARLANRSE
jgi:hypothetical protein